MIFTVWEVDTTVMLWTSEECEKVENNPLLSWLWHSLPRQKTVSLLTAIPSSNERLTVSENFNMHGSKFTTS
jgi:hypothetical protein